MKKSVPRSGPLLNWSLLPRRMFPVTSLLALARLLPLHLLPSNFKLQ